MQNIKTVSALGRVIKAERDLIDAGGAFLTGNPPKWEKLNLTSPNILHFTYNCAANLCDGKDGCQVVSEHGTICMEVTDSILTCGGGLAPIERKGKTIGCR